MPIYDLIEYSDNYSKTSVSLWHYYRDEPISDNGAIADFPASNKTVLRLNLKLNSGQNRERWHRKCKN